MPKLIKPEHVLSEDDKKSISDGITTIAQVSKDKNIPYSSIYNQVKKGKLAVTFEGKTDKGAFSDSSLPRFKDTEPTKVLDYTGSVSNFWSFIDMIFRFVCPLFKLEYIGMDKDTITDLTEKTKEKLGSLITGHQYVDWLGTIGVIGYTFVTRIHIKKKEVKNQSDSSKSSQFTRPSEIKNGVTRTKESGVGSIELKDSASDQALLLEQSQNSSQEYELTPDGHVKGKMSVEDIKKKLGL